VICRAPARPASAVVEKELESGSDAQARPCCSLGRHPAALGLRRLRPSVREAKRESRGEQGLPSRSGASAHRGRYACLLERRRPAIQLRWCFRPDPGVCRPGLGATALVLRPAPAGATSHKATMRACGPDRRRLVPTCALLGRRATSRPFEINGSRSSAACVSSERHRRRVGRSLLAQPISAPDGATSLPEAGPAYARACVQIG
jgi:hypothetical protein